MALKRTRSFRRFEAQLRSGVSSFSAGWKILIKRTEWWGLGETGGSGPQGEFQPWQRNTGGFGRREEMVRCWVFHNVHSNTLHRKRKKITVSKSTSDEEVFNGSRSLSSTRTLVKEKDKVETCYISIFMPRVEAEWKVISGGFSNLFILKKTSKTQHKEILNRSSEANRQNYTGSGRKF